MTEIRIGSADRPEGPGRFLLPADIISLVWFGILTLLVAVFWKRMDNPEVFAALHALAVGLIGIAAWTDRRFGGRFWRFVHYWMPAFLLLMSFRELRSLIPQIHSFADRAYDIALGSLDRQWFGDVPGFFREVASRPLSDLMELCYLSYFPIPLILCIALYRRGNLARFREVSAVLFFGWYLSYLGYIAVPAIGPNKAFEPIRSPELEGYIFGGPVHRLLLALEGETPDAFPSGHTLIVVLTLLMAWRCHRRIFWCELPFAVGLVMATMYLRYHYVVDVLVGLAAVPLALIAGRAIARAWESPVPSPKSRLEAAENA